MEARTELDPVNSRNETIKRDFKESMHLLPPSKGQPPVPPYERAALIIGKAAGLLYEIQRLIEVCDPPFSGGGV